MTGTQTSDTGFPASTSCVRLQVQAPTGRNFGLGNQSTCLQCNKGIATDSSGNIYVAGYTYDSLAGTNAGYEDAFVRTYNADGAELWTRQFGTASFDRATGVSVDSCGDVYLTGNTGGVYTRGADAFVRKYAANGDELWATQFGGFRLIPDHSAAICSSGDIIYAAGYDWTGSAFVSKYDVDGTALWTEQFGTGSTNATGIATDSSGNVYVAGYTASDLGGTNAGGSDAFVRKYDENGDVVWTNQSGTTYAERTSGICVDSNGNIYVAEPPSTPIYGGHRCFRLQVQADGTLVLDEADRYGGRALGPPESAWIQWQHLHERPTPPGTWTA